jgi:hypothetical protein
MQAFDHFTSLVKELRDFLEKIQKKYPKKYGIPLHLQKPMYKLRLMLVDFNLVEDLTLLFFYTM